MALQANQAAPTKDDQAEVLATKKAQLAAADRLQRVVTGGAIGVTGVWVGAAVCAVAAAPGVQGTQLASLAVISAVDCKTKDPYFPLQGMQEFEKSLVHVCIHLSFHQ